ncbi:hypothetical protein PybrP1_007125 [[Pythium] brassicae (nom. inval.)]|nr:hypothetical protein PybrP1_007125 [[Pythium] brassicae (nom. inval.)]
MAARHRAPAVGRGEFVEPVQWEYEQRVERRRDAKVDERSTTKSMYVMTSFAAPTLYLLNKVVLSVCFYCTYARHERTIAAAAKIKASGGGMRTVDDDVDADDSDERLTTKKESTGSPPGSLVLPLAPLTPGADQRRLQTVSFWVDEERQDWQMDFRDVKMLKCLTATASQRRRLYASSSVLSGCKVWPGSFSPQCALDAEQPVLLEWIPLAELKADGPSPPPADNMGTSITAVFPATLSIQPAIRFQCVISVCVYVLLLSNFARTDFAIDNLNAFHAVEPNVYVNFSPYAYAGNVYIKHSKSNISNVTSAKPVALWGSKFDTTSFSLRAFAEFLNVPAPSLRVAYPNATVDLLIVEGLKHFTIERGGLTFVAKRGADVVMIFRIRSWSTANGCSALVLDDFRYEGEA